MKKKYLLTLFIALTLLVGACGPATPVKDMSDPVTVVQTFYEAFNAKDLDRAMSLTAEDYVMNDPFGTYDRAAAATQWKAVMDGGITFNQTNLVDTGDGRVTSCYEVFENGKSIDKGCGNVTHVRDGKIIFDGLEPAEQIWIVQEFYEAFNANEIERGMSLTAEDYVMNDPFGTYDRAAAAVQWKAVRDGGITFNQTDFVNTGNGRVTSCYDVLENGKSVDKGCGNVTHVRGGKIIYDGLESAEQIWVVQKYYEALNAGKLDLAMSFIAPDALFINPTGSYEGADAIRESLAGLNTDGITFDLRNFRNTDGRIVYDYKVMQSTNLLDQGTNGLTIVKDGMVIFDGTEDTASALIGESASPAEVVQGFWAAVNSEDIETAMSLVADDIKCVGTLSMTGKDLFKIYIESTYKGTGKKYVISNLVISGETVMYDWQAYKNDFFQAGGSKESMVVKDGKIVQFNGT
ncbi:MAG TPA: nuclear transport factor 2 family protein [Anaerolineales bacterium]|nr:nuclear transport factor 2 family protein [Anaerolineales bacterium]